MVTQAPPTTEATEPENPIVAELAQPDAAGEETGTAPAQTPEATTPIAAIPVATAPTAPAIPPVVAPAEIPRALQERIDRLEAENRQAQAQNERTALGTLVGQLAQQLAQEVATEYGVTAEQALPLATKLAQRQGDMAYQQYQADRHRKGQINAAFEIGKQHNVDPRILMDLPSPEAMIAAATQATASGKKDAEVAALRAEVAQLRKGTIPAQTFANAQGMANQVADNSNIDALYMGWERANPNSPRTNPYESQYRKFIYGA